ncbi:hypothetical protein Amsp01_012820 [Amycolatopsis sp. NBRC 101858]|uniref:hypothetical protein n=1 Tax=Amycolatopsis sp. NBRC 101858 TaxID=3032200 RepID=UPI0024A0AFA0|nr:hypothetical protein [Amycolatopsis sp. NBRC 101858]GLY35258.1 hypothetical protein Amsp01_012820 [Amycolatopsis sp. NBRC 101858]
MRLFIQLADYAQGGAGQKLNAIGLGWTRTTTPLQAHVVVITLEPSVDDLGNRLKFDVRLLDHAGQPVLDNSGDDISAHVEFDVDLQQFDRRIPGLTPIILGIERGLPLVPGIYRWEVTSTESPDEIWHRSFEVLEPGVEVAQP